MNYLQIITNKEFTKAFASVMQRPAFIPVPSIFLNSIFNKERAKVSTQYIFCYILLQLMIIYLLLDYVRGTESYS